MIPYIIFIFLILLFRHYQKPTLIYLTLMLFSVLRYDTGWDYMSYYTTTDLWGSETISWEHYSIIWRWLFAVGNYLNEPHIVIAVPAFLTTTIIYQSVKLIQQDKERVSNTLTIYALWPFFYLASFSTIRQALAIAVGLLILYFAIKKKLIPFALFLFFNYYIHPSSIICVFYAVFFLPEFKMKLWHYIIIIVVFFFAIQSLNIVLSGTLLEQYASYLDTTDTFGTKLSILLAIVLIPCIAMKYMQKGFALSYYSKVIDIVIIALILTIMIYAFSSISVVSRGISYFTVLFIFVASNFPLLFKEKKIGEILVYLSFASVFVYYLISTSDAISLDMATSPFVPYKSIFSR